VAHARPLAQRRSGTPPVVQPGLGSAPHAGPRASYQAAVSQTAAPSGSPLRPRCKGDPEPSSCPAGPRASVSYRGPRKASRCGLLVPSFKWAAPGPGAVRSGTTPVSRSSRWVEPHVSLQSPVTPCCGLLVPSSKWAAPGSGAVRSGTPLVARSSRRVEPRVSLQSPHRVEPRAPHRVEPRQLRSASLSHLSSLAPRRS
jgi:hypothetical protein